MLEPGGSEVQNPGRGFRIPGFQISRFHIPRFHIPRFQDSRFQIPRFQALWISLSPCQAEIRNLGVWNPGIQIPEFHTPNPRFLDSHWNLEFWNLESWEPVGVTRLSLDFIC